MITRRPVPTYVAASSQELARVLPIITQLESSGLVTITHRWFDAVAKHGVGNDASLPSWQQREHAKADLKGVSDAAVFWCLLPETPSLGASFELGYAYGMLGVSNTDSDLRIVATGPRTRGFIFGSLVWRHESDAMGLAYVLETAREIQDGQSGPVGSVP